MPRVLQLLPEDAFEHLVLISRVERRQAGDHLIQHGAEAVVIDAVAVGLAVQHLRTHVLSGAAVSLVQNVFALHFRQTEVCKLDVAVDVDEYILRLEISVDNVLSMNVLQAEEDLGKIELRFSLGKKPFVLQEVEQLTT